VFLEHVEIKNYDFRINLKKRLFRGAVRRHMGVDDCVACDVCWRCVRMSAFYAIECICWRHYQEKVGVLALCNQICASKCVNWTTKRHRGSLSRKIRMIRCLIQRIDMMTIWKHVLNLLWCMCNMLINRKYHMLTNILRNVIYMTFGSRLAFSLMYTNMRKSYKCGMEHAAKMIL